MNNKHGTDVWQNYIKMLQYLEPPNMIDSNWWQQWHLLSHSLSHIKNTFTHFHIQLLVIWSLKLVALSIKDLLAL